MASKTAKRPSFVSKWLYCFVSICLLASAFAVIYTKHLSRQLFAQLQLLEQETESLQTEWRQLLVEQATWIRDARVERVAKERLQMRVPEPSQIVVVAPGKSSSSTT